eukprot:SAG22_NODE_12077_length_457_cov_0.865922_1_plen_113_part_01
MAAAAGVSALVAAVLDQPLPPEVASYAGSEARGYTHLGMELFKRNRVAESVSSFDRTIAIAPQQRPYMWQRGLSLFYLERLEEAMEQFEIDVAANPNDTEESIWRMLAQVRLL